MRPLALFFVIILIIGMTIIPASAFDWPPKNYDMPRTAITEDTAAYALSGIKSSLGSIANIGIKIMGIIASVTLISSLFNSLVLRKMNGSQGKGAHQSVDALERSSFDGATINREKISFGSSGSRSMNFGNAVQGRIERIRNNKIERRIYESEHEYSRKR